MTSSFATSVLLESLKEWTLLPWSKAYLSFAVAQTPAKIHHRHFHRERTTTPPRFVSETFPPPHFSTMACLVAISLTVLLACGTATLSVPEMPRPRPQGTPTPPRPSRRDGQAGLVESPLIRRECGIGYLLQCGT